MLDRKLLSEALKVSRDDFDDFKRLSADETEFYQRIIENASKLSSAEIEKRIESRTSPGAIPSGEIDRYSGFCVNFDQTWQNHRQARAWALPVLAERTTFAADASQIQPGRDVSIPVAAVQVGWFENPHTELKNYIKGASFRVLTPKELLQDQEEPINPESKVSAIRFEEEARRIVAFLESKKDWQARGERMPVAFFDGTLLVSFSKPDTALQSTYVNAILEVINVSKECRVPVVGYVDSSYSRDLICFLEAFANEKPANRIIFDSRLAQPGSSSSILKKWGDRTIFCRVKRSGLGEFVDRETGKPNVGMVYLQTTGEDLPSRLDIPSWVFDAGFADEVIDVVRAECIVGLGYPYALETADATAVISVTDREIFLKALQEFSKRGKLGMTFSRKSSSKRRRR
ncbi:MAG: DNA double-strand break repair nuclease NurA [Pyrinomonadaceae bacterium]|nr:DNA double-strand break repair nuclease NurA [Pyrinomonadaceae bacterium]